MQKQNSFNAARGASVPRAVGTPLRPCPPRVSPDLSSTTNTTDTQREEQWVAGGGRCGTCSWAQPQSTCAGAEKKSSGSSPRSPSRSSAGMGSMSCVCGGLWNCSGWEPGPAFHRTGNLPSPPSVGLTHPGHIHQLPAALPSWDQSSVGTGRSPQDLHCVHLSWTVPSAQEQGHPEGAAQGGLGSAQPGQGPAKPPGDELLQDFSIPSPRGSQQPPRTTSSPPSPGGGSSPRAQVGRSGGGCWGSR